MRKINVTKQAKEVFGNRVVKSAYVVDVWDDIDKSTISLSDIDSDELVIEFNGGNKVSFKSSEWCSIVKTEE